MKKYHGSSEETGAFLSKAVEINVEGSLTSLIQQSGPERAVFCTLQRAFKSQQRRHPESLIKQQLAFSNIYSYDA